MIRRRVVMVYRFVPVGMLLFLCSLFSCEQPPERVPVPPCVPPECPDVPIVPSIKADGITEPWPKNRDGNCTPKKCREACDLYTRQQGPPPPKCCYPCVGSPDDDFWWEIEKLPEFDDNKPAGCTDPRAQNYDEAVEPAYDDGSCTYGGGFKKLKVGGTSEKDTYRNVFVEAFKSTQDGAGSVTGEALFRVESLTLEYAGGRNLGNRMYFLVLHPIENFEERGIDPYYRQSSKNRVETFYSSLLDAEGNPPIPFICVSQNTFHQDHQFFAVDEKTDDSLYRVVLRGVRSPHLVDIAIQPVLKSSTAAGSVNIDVVMSFKIRDVKVPASGERLIRDGFFYRLFVSRPPSRSLQRNAASQVQAYQTKYPDLYAAPAVAGDFIHRGVVDADFSSGEITSIKFLSGEATYTRRVEVFVSNLPVDRVANLELTVIVYDNDEEKPWVWNVERTTAASRVIWEKEF